MRKYFSLFIGILCILLAASCKKDDMEKEPEVIPVESISLDQPYAAFRFLPEGFTLTQLQQIYEMILEKKLLMANFRRKILPYVEETDEIERGAGHRPSRLYRKKAIQSEFIL